MRKQVRRRALSMTSLIDVIFLLLLFFMLSSTFSRFSEVELTSGQGKGPPSEATLVFLHLGADTLALNGRVQGLDDLPEALSALANDAAASVIVSLKGDVSAQRLTDLLVATHGIAGLTLTVLEPT